MKYLYRTLYVGPDRSGMHHTHDLEEAKLVSADGVIERKPDGEWEVVPDA